VNLRRWLTPGIGVKRWLLLTFLGCLVLALGVAHIVRQATRDFEPDGLPGFVLDIVTLQFLPYALRGILVVGFGLVLMGFGAYRTLRALTAPFMPSQGGRLVELIYQRKSLARGPRVVVIGGGTGQSTILRGLKEHTSNLSAIVAVADDGGSSGVLRDTLAIPPVGDIRRCLAALADDETLVGEVLEHRFAGSPTHDGPEAGGPLGGHPVGNILLAAMTQLEEGDFEEAVRLANRVLAVRGQVLPAAAAPLTLHARLHDGSVVDGQSVITRARGIDRAWITPSEVPACDDALAAIADAEVIVLGPGSLYTSLLPSLLVPALRDAILQATAPRLYVCNVATQAGETTGFDLAAHVDALATHTSPELIDLVLANNRLLPRTDSSATAVSGNASRTDPPLPRPTAVGLRWPPVVAPAPRLILDDVVDPANAHHHDPVHLAAAVMKALEREAGIRRRSPGRSSARTA
jgi:uncharacterized cofD-like protein